MPRVSAVKDEVERAAADVRLCNEVERLLRDRRRRQKDLLEKINSHYDRFLVELPVDILRKPLSQLNQDDIQRIRDIGLGASALEEKPKFQRASRARGNVPSRGTRNQLKVDEFQTPMNRNIPSHHMGTVTPKFNPYAPMSVVRVPKEGEMAMSLTGSPLRVTSVINDSKPNVIVPLNNGRVLSVLPERGIRMSQIPEMDDKLIGQLQVLNENLTTLLSQPSKGKSTTKKK